MRMSILESQLCVGGPLSLGEVGPSLGDFLFDFFIGLPGVKVGGEGGTDHGHENREEFLVEAKRGHQGPLEELDQIGLGQNGRGHVGQQNQRQPPEDVSDQDVRAPDLQRWCFPEARRPEPDRESSGGSDRGSLQRVPFPRPAPASTRGTRPRTSSGTWPGRPRETRVPVWRPPPHRYLWRRGSSSAAPVMRPRPRARRNPPDFFLLWLRTRD